MTKWRKVKKEFKKKGRQKWIGKEIVAMCKGGATYRSEIVDVKIHNAGKWRIRYTPIIEPVELPKELYNMNPVGFYIDDNFYPL